MQEDRTTTHKGAANRRMSGPSSAAPVAQVCSARASLSQIVTGPLGSAPAHLSEMGSGDHAIEHRDGQDEIDPGRHHNQRRMAPTGPAKLLRDLTRPFYSRFVSDAGRDWLRHVVKPYFTETPGTLYEQLLKDPEIDSFIARHYAEDLDLYHSLGRKHSG